MGNVGSVQRHVEGSELGRVAGCTQTVLSDQRDSIIGQDARKNLCVDRLTKIKNRLVATA